MTKITSFKKDGAGNVEILAEIAWEKLSEAAEQALMEYAKTAEIQGFRKGQAPLDMVRSRVNDHAILEDAAEHLVQDAYPEILKEKDLRPITRPFLTFRKLARGNALEFSVHFSVMPEFKLPNYAKIGKEALKDMPAIVITDEEVDNTIKTIQMMRMGKDAKEAELPALTDESVKAYGDFASVLDFKTKVREHLKQEKETEEQTKTREKIITALLEATPFELPTILLAQEVADAEARREQEITRMGSTMDDYLKRIGKTKEDLATQEKEAISRGLRARFILDAIAEDGKIEPKEEDVDAHVTLLMQQYPESDPESAKAYVRDTLREEATFALLEGKAVVS